MRTPHTLKSFPTLSLVSFALLLGATPGRSDVTSLREKGPTSGSLFSNPGLTLESPDIKMAMRTATVNIQLKRGGANTLVATCEAVFEMENLADAGVGPQDFLAAFPATGLSAKAVNIENFSVTVDGKAPPLVLRRNISIGRRESRFTETPIAGQLEARFALEKSRYKAVGMADQSYYLGAYIWAQRTNPKTTSQVRVTYTATLRPQPIVYTKTIAWDSAQREVIPFGNLNADGENGDHFFFDYVLLSGSTWEGPIGHETITLTLAPELKNKLCISLRNPLRAGVVNGEPNEVRGRIDFEDYKETSDSILIEIKNEKPTYDLLFALPVSALAKKT